MKHLVADTNSLNVALLSDGNLQFTTSGVPMFVNGAQVFASAILPSIRISRGIAYTFLVSGLLQPFCIVTSPQVPVALGANTSLAVSNCVTHGIVKLTLPVSGTLPSLYYVSGPGQVGNIAVDAYGKE